MFAFEWAGLQTVFPSLFEVFWYPFQQSNEIKSVFKIQNRVGHAQL